MRNRLLAMVGWFLLVPLSVGAFEFKAALPGYSLRFPRDHAAHEAYKTEWWYYTGHLTTEDNRRYGYELTFFRIGLDGKSQAYAAHFALTDEASRTFHYAEKLNRSGWELAGARPDVYYVWNELWSAAQLGDRHVLEARFDQARGGQAVHLALHPLKAPALHGQNGLSQKASCRGCASHYYSLTRMRTEGFLIDAQGRARRVTGLSWMDHEFGSNQLGKNQVGWDWFSLQLNNGVDVMLYLLRTKDGGLDPNSSGTLVEKDGRTRHLSLTDFTVTPSGRTWTSPRTGGRYPVGWTLRIPSEQAELTVTPVMDNQELSTAGSTGVSYWEGSSRLRGRMRGQAVNGQAYVEMTGYARAFEPEI